MGVPTTPTEAVPSYDDVINNHPVNRYTPSGSLSGYTTIPQCDDADQPPLTRETSDLERNAYTHTHSSLPPSQQQQQQQQQRQPETFAQTITKLLLPQSDSQHKHCTACDEQVQTAARQKRESERYCCTMVAVTFITLFMCGMVLGVVIVNANARGHKESHGGI
ncbi:hypothetical protein COCC4DRAFT_140155 [Bipolaris maydis ATCC 48331]|uniref:LITAF domain-containing protein n=2 Tax=Cochliobolus heterostrophus TaxID=5016 RepID=M2VBS6_COCH5|nr:uncharacterized protein COCC4DRAFT_140155 [Bipolaris maydis ATCC 48331]EMD97377.1 hypothetical protein COCHEDRAFT_1084791 [Bipolaris maydis C5]KAH7551272.1 hypothetical protein BM1_09588 [Bipolaris maydis]ENI04167.1 hypothetical protein COCC4DRAFT_140155 [Bipolaris maydis ATCC 48331]KAJ5029792.1 hypothetical protein J3E73DRAFT_288627 [Bipolaris maydis]KAJ5055181.1 hypothetical protein J3E74DRAFT_384275 [Bipolaris maydis]